ncbi:MAG: hemerythrin family protein [bacterium]|nr:hemerythrin family protein [bacterium]
MYEMKEEYKIGVPLIDEEHTHLFELVEEAYQLLKQEFLVEKYDQIMNLLLELKAYTIHHFSDEEAYMESIDYPALFIQKAQHKAFVEKLEDLDNMDLDKEQDKVIEDLLAFLTDWLVNHIMKVDKLITQTS